MEKLLVPFLIKYGKEYKPAVEPIPLERGDIGRCFDYSMLSAMKTGYRYVEGIATAPDGKPRLHAWVTDSIHAYDPTWKAEDNKTKERRPIPATYIGLEMDTRAVAKFMTATEYQGVFANAHRNPTLAKAIHPKIPIIK